MKRIEHFMQEELMKRIEQFVEEHFEHIELTIELPIVELKLKKVEVVLVMRRLLVG